MVGEAVVIGCSKALNIEQGDGSLPNHAARGAYSKDCATRRTLARIADKWTILIVGRLSQAPCRFGKLLRSMKASRPRF